MSIRYFSVRTFFTCLIVLLSVVGGCQCNYLVKPAEQTDEDTGRFGGETLNDATNTGPDDAPADFSSSEEETSDSRENDHPEPPPEPPPEPELPCESGRREACQSNQPGLCGPGIRTCTNKRWGKCIPLQTPEAERCNGLDDDCDGKIDNQKNTPQPITQSCYPRLGGCSGKPGSYQCKGVCRPGLRSCTNGQWGTCTKPVTPKKDICNDGLDNNCDGLIDETCECDLGQIQDCWPGNIKQCPKGKPCVGICKRGTQFCTQSRTWGVCLRAVLGKPEVCNGLDDDCDGKIDNKQGDQPLEQTCYSGPANTRGVGECKDGVQQCVRGRWGSCVGDTLPSVEKYCGLNPSKDFNCDGIPNNFKNIGGACIDPSRKGICQPGTWQCIQDKIACGATESPRAETCNNLDDDCDGTIDEGVVRECPYGGPPKTKGVGICKVGRQFCKVGLWGRCIGEVLPKTEICNRIDDNCNGTIDEFVPLQQVGPATIYSRRGSPAHVYLTATDVGYVLGWSDGVTQKVSIALTKANGARQGKDIPITQGKEFGNIHGLTYTGNRIVVTWDSDKNASSGDALIIMLDNNGKRLIGPKLLAKGGRMVNPQVATGPGFLGVLWSDYISNKLSIQTFDMKLQPLSKAPHTFPLSTRNSPYPGLSFSGDRLATVWTTSTNKLKVAVVDKFNKKIGESEIPNAGKIPANATIAGDRNGFLLVWSDLTNGKLLGQRIDRNAKPVGVPLTIATSNARTPIMRATSYGGLIAWIQRRGGKDGVSVAWVDNKGKLLATPSWFAVPNIVDYLALAWKDTAQGRGRGAIAWLDQANVIRVAPLGCK